MKLIGFFLITLIVAIQSGDECQCKVVDDLTTTCWRSVEGNIPVEGGKVKQISGVVVDENESPLGGTLIELFDNPDQDIDKRKRIASCWAGKDGEFCFKGIKPGRYELRGSCSEGFQAGSTIITLDPKHKKGAKKILVKLTVAI